MAKVIVVGAGLFGQVAADWARREGHEVTTIDASLPNRASPAAGCVLKPSWLASIPKERVAKGLAVLDELYGVEEFMLHTKVGLSARVQRVDPDKILRVPDIQARVLSVSDGVVKLDNGQRLQGIVLVAAGIWCQELIPGMPNISALAGASARFKGQLEKSRIDIYAPYRQAVAFNINKKQVWFGDGTAIKAHNWSDERLLKSSERAEDTFGLVGGKWITGFRPYVEGHKAGFFQKISKKLYISTGGAKNGITLAGAQAAEFAEAIK